MHPPVFRSMPSRKFHRPFSLPKNAGNLHWEWIFLYFPMIFLWFSYGFQPKGQIPNASSWTLRLHRITLNAALRVCGESRGDAWRTCLALLGMSRCQKTVPWGLRSSQNRGSPKIPKRIRLVNFRIGWLWSTSILGNFHLCWVGNGRMTQPTSINNHHQRSHTPIPYV
jgi:hypothetical protein